MIALVVYGAVVGVLLVLAIPGEMRPVAPAPRRERRPVGRVDPGAGWAPLRRRPSLPAWLAEDPGPMRQGVDGWWSGVAVAGGLPATPRPLAVRRLALPLRTGAGTNVLPFRSPTTWRRSYIAPVTQRMEALAR